MALGKKSSSLFSLSAFKSTVAAAAEFESNDFVQNSVAGFVAHDTSLWLPYPGPQRRVGFSSFVHKNTHYDGGWEAEGIENILGGGGYAVFASDFDDPGATLNATYEGITFVDARSPLWGMCFCVCAQRCNIFGTSSKYS